MTKMLGRKTKLTQHGVTDEMSPRFTKELERQEAKLEIKDQMDLVVGNVRGFRYVIEYTTNAFHGTNYDTVFYDFKDAQVFLCSAVWHIGSKCKRGTFAIKSITLQHKVSNLWVDYNE